MRRAARVQPVIPMAITTTLTSPTPKKLTIIRMMKNTGNDRTTSTNLMSTLSTQPPM